MKKEHFLHRSVSIKSEAFRGLEVIRTRTSEGFSSITLVYPIKKEILRITLTNEDETEETAGDYERKAVEIGNIMRAIADDPCNLPEE